MTQPTNYHRPVLLMESVDMLKIREDGAFVDTTFGGGGHSREMLSRIGEQGRLIAFDRDADAHLNIIKDQRLKLVRSDFKFIENVLMELEPEGVDGILADLGISSHQIDVPERGFSFRFEGQLDMRMNQDQDFSAVSVLNEYQESKLIKIFRDYGEIRNAVGIARSIVEKRKGSPLQTTGDLRAAIADAVSAKNLGKILTLVYQAIRIEVNNELESLQALLLASAQLIRPGGRLAIIAYHSLEDRMVKNFFRYGNLNREDHRDVFGNPLSPWKVITRKAIKPSDQEIAENPRARSARLRVAERK